MPSSVPPCCSPATAPSSGRRGRVGADPHKVGVLVRGRAEQRRLAITSQRIPAPGAADTGGTPSGTKPRRWARTLTPRSPPRARHPLIRAAQSQPNREANISVSRPPPRPAPPPPPRRFRAHIPDMCAAPPPPPHPPPTLRWARAGRTPSREAEAHAVRRRRSNHSTEKTWSPRAARARATRRPRARSAAAASRPTRSRPTRPSAPRGPLGKTSLLKSRRPRRRTPTRPSLGGDVEELTEQEYR